MYKTDTKTEVKRLRAITFNIFFRQKKREKEREADLEALHNSMFG